jgi:hypothetical protein
VVYHLYVSKKGGPAPSDFCSDVRTSFRDLLALQHANTIEIHLDAKLTWKGEATPNMAGKSPMGTSMGAESIKILDFPGHV